MRSGKRSVAPRTPATRGLSAAGIGGVPQVHPLTADDVVVRFVHRVSLVVSAALVALLIASAGVYLTNLQRAASRQLRHDFATSATLSAELTGNVLSSAFAKNADYARRLFGGPEGGVQAAVDADQKVDPAAQTTILASDGRVLGSFPPVLTAENRKILSRPEIQLALTGRAGFSGVVTIAGARYVMVSIPYSVAGGLRVWTASLPIAQIQSFMAGNLATSNAVTGGSAFALDDHGFIVAAANARFAGRPLADRALAAASLHGSSGSLNGDTWESAPVSGSTWRIVFSAPAKALLAPLAATRRVAWQAFGVFALAILCALGLAAFALRSAHRLAYARLHDELTGLPNRAVFMKRAEQALAHVRLRGGHLATLFIDLDQFKPINDEHGHAAGDIVLTAVAARLRDSVRSGDLVSRFGGDEFLVLCSALIDREQAIEIARRIQRALADPFDISGVPVTMSASIGVAFHSSTDLTIDVDSLVGYADLAMYEAKKHGRAGIELMASGTATPVGAGP